MPKLLQINAALNRGSTGRIAEQIGMLAKEQGWNVYIAHGARYKGKSALQTIQVVTEKEEKLHALKSMALDAHGLGSRKATEKLIARIKEISPDIIHLHNIHGYYLNYKLLFEYLATIDTPVIWTLHDCWTMTGHCAHFDAIGCDKWKTGCYNCPLKREYPRSILLDRSAHNYAIKKELFSSLKNATIVPVSNWLGSIVKDSYLGNYTVNVINNGVDLEIFKSVDSSKLRKKLGIGNKTVLLGVATTWHNEKGLREFIHLSENPEYQVIMVGVPTEINKNLPKEIIAIERTNSQQELAEYYSIADMLVNPTYNDSFPTVNLEALACGTPVVTFRTGGSPESITPETGIVVEKGEFEQLVNAIETVREKGKAHYSAACRERAVALYNKDDRFMEYMNLYCTLIEKNK
ncbi:MAG: glycosyltransferase [Bacteroidaceae bacterium]|nr:glycosyltransferase [Bacteroidaceae bacterium]